MEKAAVQEKVECYHCGEYCSDRSVHIGDDKFFCCEGCKLVYELLEENDLCTYYNLEDTPGISQQHQSQTSRFDYLEDDSVVQRLLDYRDDTQSRLTLYIPAIHCSSCIWLLENMHKLDEGVLESTVHFLRRELTLSFDHNQTSLRLIVERLTSIGYEPEIQLDQLDNKQNRARDRRLWLKLGLAGFAFGNIMLFSFPEYLTDQPLEGHFKTIFGILNIALATPVLLYSANDYLKSAWAAVKQFGVNLDVPISLGILVLFTRSVYEIATGIGVGYLDSFSGLIFFLLIGKVVQQKTYERLSFDRDFKSYFPISITKVDGDGERSVSVDQLEPGDYIRVRNHELVPADSMLLSDHAHIDYSFVTGESDPVDASKGDTIYAGGRLVGSSVVMEVNREVSNSYLTKLWNNAAFSSNQNENTISSWVDRISAPFTFGVLITATLAGLWWLPAGIGTAINIFTAVLIVACPCALALSTPFTLGSALHLFARNGFFVKNTRLVEQLSNITTMVFDKTGTLTHPNRAEITFRGTDISDEEQKLIAAAISQSIHPLSRKLFNHLDHDRLPEVTDFEERLNRGIIATIDRHKVIIGSEQLLREEAAITVPDINKSSASTVFIAINGRYRGVFEICNDYRDGLPNLFGSFKPTYSLHLLSGDNDREQQRFESLIDPANMHFRQSPQDKLSFIEQLREQGERVLMVGDGLNDAGALKRSDFGIALTDDISAFSPACDAIIEADALSRMDQFIRLGKSGMNIILASFGISLIYNLGGLGFAVAGLLTPLIAAILMPLSSLTIMLFTSTSIHLKAKSMGLRTWK